MTSLIQSERGTSLSAIEQNVIRKLFRRPIVFLFILFFFSFLDRINIGFAGLSMGQERKKHTLLPYIFAAADCG